MNTHILQRLFMVNGDPNAAGKQLWIMPAILEVFGFSSILKAFDTFDGGKRWFVWLGYAAAGAVLIAGGILWAVFRRKIAELWPWNQLRTMRSELAQVSMQNSELREVLNIPKGLAALPAPKQDRLVKPQHNVQFVNFTIFDNDDLISATLCFQNVPNGNLLGKFERPRLRVLYYYKSTGEEVADMCPTEWWSESGDIPTEITADRQYAIVASFFKEHGTWKALERNESYDGSDPWHELNSKLLPTGEIHIIASLSGANDPQIPRVEGVLTLGDDGTASFQRISD